MRIVSLLPSATEWLFAFGAGGDVVGRSHACDFPAEAAALPVVSRALLPPGRSAAEIDAAVRDAVQAGGSLYDVDLDLLARLAPDLLVTQAQCDVCAVSAPLLQERLAAWTEDRPAIHAMEPYTLRQALDAALHLAVAAGRMAAAIPVLGEAEVRLADMRDRLGLHKRSDVSTFPTVACIEWLDPLMIAGHWVPDVAAMAGGRAVLTASGERTRAVGWEALRAADPDVIAVMPCGLALAETRRDIAALTGQPGWPGLRAVRSGRVHLFDGNAYFNRPGPRLYRSIELLAQALYPGRLAADAAPWESASL